MRPPDAAALRVGILCDGTTFQRWQAEAIRHLLAVPGVEPVLLVVNASRAGERKGLADRVVKYPFSRALYLRYRKYHFKPAAMAREDLSGLLQGVPVLNCTPERSGPTDSFREEDLDAIASHRPDVLLRFGFNILQGDILTLPRHGVWSFHHGDPERFRGGPPGFWEIMTGEPLTGAVLQRLTKRLDAGLVLRQGWFRTVDHSLRETVDTVLGHSAMWPAQVARELLAGRMEAATGTPVTEPGPLFRYPGNTTFLRFLWRQARNKLRFHRDDLRAHEEWNIGVLYQPITALIEEDIGQNVRWLPTPKVSTFRADPFGYVTADGQLNVIYEKYDHAVGRGEIARLRPKKDNLLKRSRTLLATEGHLSYPYVVQQGGNTYVVPESADTGRVDLFRVNDANDALEPLGTLLREPLYDPTVFEHEGRWWLFGTKAPLTNTALYAYWSDRLEGPYTAHALNPIKLDTRSARPAGTPFLHAGELWRPAQDASLTYGGRVALNRVMELAPDRFREETVKFVGPLKGTDYPDGLHTLCAMGDLTLIDGKRTVTVPERAKAARRRKIAKLKHKGKP